MSSNLSRRLAALAALAAVSALTLAAPAGARHLPARSGLYGVLMRGPTKPVCEASQPCQAPAPGVTLVFSGAGGEVARVRTGRQGAYRIVLAPGLYRVRTTLKPFGRVPQPQTVRVRDGRFAHVDFTIDTGIR